MKAKISELWQTGIEILTIEGADEFSDSIGCMSELKKCENVLVGDKIKGTNLTEVLIDNDIRFISFRLATHPTGCGKLKICEIQ